MMTLLQQHYYCCYFSGECETEPQFAPDVSVCDWLNSLESALTGSTVSLLMSRWHLVRQPV